MNNDYITLKALAYELNNDLSNAVVRRIFQPSNDTIVLGLYSTLGSKNLLISANKGYPIITTIDDKFTNPFKPLLFCTYLRSNILNSKIEYIKLLKNDRIFEIKLNCMDELNNCSEKYLIFEHIGRHSNIFVLDNKKRLNFALLKSQFRFQSDIYEVRESNKINIENTSQVIDLLKDTNCEKNFYKNVSGISQITAREIYEKYKVKNSLEFSLYLNDFLSINKSSLYKPCCINNTALTYPYTTISSDILYYNSLQQAFLESFKLHVNINKINKRLNKYIKITSQAIKKHEKQITLTIDKIKNLETSDIYTQKGNLILANLYKIKQGDTNIVLQNFYNNNEEIKITLNPNLSATLNAKKYFKKQQGIIKTRNYLTTLLSDLSAKLDELNSINLYMNIHEHDNDEIDVIEKKLFDLKLIKSKKKKIKNIKNKYIHLKDTKYDIYIGKNDIQNDEITFKLANSNDLWFHVQNKPGSHLLLKANVDINDELLYKCASLAKKYSAVANESNISVDYTMKKYVKRHSSKKLAMVCYTNQKTIIIN